MPGLPGISVPTAGFSWKPVTELLEGSESQIGYLQSRAMSRLVLPQMQGTCPA